MVPTHFVRLLALPDEVRARYDLSSVKWVGHTGAACPVDVKRRMIEWWGPVFFDAYGATEVGTTCMITSEEWLEHPGSVGRAIPPFSAIVVDEDGNEVPAGTEGRIYFEDSTGRGVVYPNDPQKTADAHLRPGVFTLGEIGYVDDDGYVYITDRFSDLIVSGGVNIYPAEAEQVLIEHPEVADVAVIGVPHEEMGEAVKALVVPADPSQSAGRGRPRRVLPGAAGRLQVPAHDRHRRHRRPHHDGQDQQAGPPGAVLGLGPHHRGLAGSWLPNGWCRWPRARSSTSGPPRPSTSPRSAGTEPWASGSTPTPGRMPPLGTWPPAWTPQA